MTLTRVHAFSVVSLGLLLAVRVQGQPAPAPPPRAVPAPLAPWVPWVLEGVPERACAFSGGQALCHWPGRLELELAASGGRFTQQVLVDRKRTFALPGSVARWPLGVKVDGRAVPVLDQDGAPTLELLAGSHRLEGRFEWRALPERLEVPADTALIALRIDGASVAFPRRDEQGQLWLLGKGAQGEESEQLGLVVTRKVTDGVPLTVTTRIALRVAGRAREVSLGRVLLTATAPLSLESELPARLEADGELRVQVRAGTHAVEVHARGEGALEQLAFEQAGSAWPESEVWVWQADEALRQVELSGAPAVDAARTELDEDWRALPAFALREGVALRLRTTRRGEASPPPNSVTLARELWLDLDGRGYTVRDRIEAQLRQGFRLDLTQGELGHVSANGEDLLITRSAEGDRAGVELRAAASSIVAEWRAPELLGSLPAVGWSEDVQSLGARLHLGPGYSVLAASGVDGLSQSWLQDWDLFDFFFVLLVAAAVAQLAGRRTALLSLVLLVLCHDENDAPSVVWFALLATIALVRALPEGRLRSAARVGFGVSVGSLLLVALPFAVGQIRGALYPQLGIASEGVFELGVPLIGLSRQAMVEEPGVQGIKIEDEAASVPVSAPVPAAPSPAPVEQEATEMDDGLAAQGTSEAGGALRDEPARGKAPLGKLYSRALQQDPEATVQTGPGVPTWRWRSWELRWSGPVDQKHQVELYLIPPWVNRALALLRVLLLGVFVALLLRVDRAGRDRSGAPPPAGPVPAATQAAVGVALLLATSVLGVASSARAQLPDQALLDQLRARLTEPPPCRPGCVSIDELELTIANQTLELTLAVHAQDRTTVRLPGPASAWVPAEIRLDGREHAPAIALDDGFVHVRVEPGVHELRARGPLPPRDSLTLAVLDLPHRARVRAEGYDVDGVREDGRVEGALQLSRRIRAREDEPTLADTALPPWLLLERTLELGPSWRMTTRLSRVSPTGTPIRTRVPLLPGESVTESALEVAGGAVQVSFGRDDEEVAWTSQLATRDSIALVAAAGNPWSERWSLLCGPMWRCEPSGLTPTSRLTEGRYQPRWTPWPGERVSVRVLRPEPAKGQSITLDAARLRVTPGVRMQSGLLDLEVRSSRGGTQQVRLPAGARVQSLLVNGVERPLRVSGERVAFTLEPGGRSVQLLWQQPEGMSFWQRTPRVELGRAAANARVTLEVPEERWLLWVTGPSWGPAVLFWGYLVMVVLAALALGRVRAGAELPLRTRDWLLLGLGLTQVPVPAALTVVGWFFALRQRAQMPPQSRWAHNLLQLALFGLTLGALGCLYGAVHGGLLLRPDMQVAGAGSSASELHWYVDRSSGALPQASMLSVPLWVFRLLMLAWSLWLASRLLRWLRWGFDAFKQGGLWRKAPQRALRDLPGADLTAAPGTAGPGPSSP